MAGFSVTVTGIAEARRDMAALKDGAQAAAHAVVLVGFRRVYAYGIETGRKYRSGKLARRAGGAWMLRTGLRAVQGQIQPEIAQALPKGPQAVLSALLRLGHRVEAVAKPLTPVGKVRGGTLRRDLHTTAGRRAGE